MKKITPTVKNCKIEYGLALLIIQTIQSQGITDDGHRCVNGINLNTEKSIIILDPFLHKQLPIYKLGY